MNKQRLKMGFAAIGVLAVLGAGLVKSNLPLSPARFEFGLTEPANQQRPSPAHARRERASSGLEAMLGTEPTYVVAASPIWSTEFAYIRNLSGRAEAARRAELGFERAGSLARVLVDEGDAVVEGQLLAVLDTDVLNAQRAELRAQLAAVEADAKIAERTYRRYRGIVSEGGVSRQALDEAREAWQAAAARAQLARRQVESNATWLAKSELRAPFAGVIIARRADEGRVLPIGFGLLQLQDSAPPRIRIGLGGRLVEQLELGEIHRLRWGGQELAATVVALIPRRARRARTVDALFELVDPRFGVRPGDMFTLALEQTIPEPGFWAPIAALHEGARGMWSVYVVADVDRSRAQRRSVIVLGVESDRVFIHGLLSPTELLVIGGADKIVPGQAVSITRVDGLPPERRAVREGELQTAGG